MMSNPLEGFNGVKKMGGYLLRKALKNIYRLRNPPRVGYCAYDQELSLFASIFLK
jgi:hypothetical protein